MARKNDGRCSPHHNHIDDTIKGFNDEEISAMSGRIVCPGVPPKNKKEAKAHLIEIEKLREYERQLMTQEAKSNRRRREEHSKAIEHWATKAIPNWGTEQGRGKETIRLWSSQGIAPEMRAKVWSLAIGNPRSITQHMYEICLNKAKERMRKHRGQPVPERENYDPAHFSPKVSKVESAAMIDVDLPRTFLISKAAVTDTGSEAPQSPQLIHSPTSRSPRTRSPTPREIDMSSPESSSHNDEERSSGFEAAAGGNSNTSEGGASPLTRAAMASPSSLSSSALLISRFNNDELLMRLNLTLRAFVEFRPDVGYVQGMSYIAAMLLMHLEEEAAFVGLATMMTLGHFPYFYTVNHQGMSAHIQVFEEVFAVGSPDVHRNFTVIGVNPQMYIIDWWMSLFSRTLPFEIAARCWDLYFLDPAYLYRISMSILIYFGKYLHEDAPLDEVMQFLSRVQKSWMDEDRFFGIVADTATYGPDIADIHKIMDKHLTPLENAMQADDDDL